MGVINSHMNPLSLFVVDITPSVEVIEHCAAFLANIQEWEYLSNLCNSADGFIEVSFF